MNTYVDNLSYEVTEDNLQGAFSSFGHVALVNIVDSDDAHHVGNKTRNPLHQHGEAR